MKIDNIYVADVYRIDEEKVVADYLLIGEVKESVALYLETTLVRKSKYSGLYIDLNTGEKYKSNMIDCKRGENFVHEYTRVSVKEISESDKFERCSKRKMLKKISHATKQITQERNKKSEKNNDKKEN